MVPNECTGDVQGGGDCYVGTWKYVHPNVTRPNHTCTDECQCRLIPSCFNECVAPDSDCCE